MKVEIIGRAVALPTGIPLTVKFTAHALDEGAITLTMQVARGDVAWVFARNLLVDGVNFPVGYGDVSIFPPLTRRHQYMEIILDPGDEHRVALKVRRDFLLDVLKATERMWPVSSHG
jgi:hypothetical protein